MSKKIFFIRSCWFLIFLIFSLSLYSQPNQQITQSRLDSYFKMVEDYESRLNRGDTSISEKELKQYYRWRWFWDTRIDENGRYEKYWSSLNEHIQKYDKYSILKSESTEYEFNWKSLGPFSSPERICGSLGQTNPTGVGRFDAIWVNPSDHCEILVGSFLGGLWYSDDCVPNWTPLTDEINAWGVQSICVNPTDQDEIYIATGVKDPLGPRPDHNYYGMGVFKSTDRGQSWESCISDTVSKYLFMTAILMHPNDPDIIYALSHTNVYKTIDGGQNWSSLNPPISSDTRFTEMLFKPNNPSTIYISSLNGEIYRSTNGGTTWSNNLGSGLHNTYSMTNLGMSISEQESDALYVCYRDSTFSLSKLEKSRNSGSAWTLLCQDYLQNTMEHIIKVSPYDSTNIYIGSVWFYKYNPATYRFDLKTTRYDNHSNYMHDDVRAIEVYQEDGTDVIIAGHDGGVSISYDEGDTWSYLNGDICCSEFFTVSVYDTIVDYLAGGTQDCSSHILKDKTWFNTSCRYADGGTTLIDYSDKDIIFVSGNRVIYRTDNGGSNFSSPIVYQKEYTTPLIQHPTGPDTIYSWSNTLWRLCKSPDKGDTFDASTIFDPNHNGPIVAMEICESNPNIFYYASAYYNAGGTLDSSSLIRTLDNGNTWKCLSKNVGSILASSRITAIEINPGNSEEIWISFGNLFEGQKVYYSSNGGSSWSNISGTLEVFPINDLEFDNEREILYCCTDAGVFVNDDGTDWIEFGTGLPEIMCTKLDINSRTNELYVSTHGRGIWKVDMQICFDPIDTIYVNSTATWGSSPFTICSDIIIQNGATLIVSNDQLMGHNATIYIKDNSTLQVLGASIINANIIIESGGTLELDEESTLILDENDNITTLSGGILDINSGSIEITN